MTDFEEDVVLKNSPLDLYLEQFDNDYEKVNNTSNLLNVKSEFLCTTPKLFGFNINKLLFKGRLKSLVTHINSIGILDDVDLLQIDHLVNLNFTDSNEIFCYIYSPWQLLFLVVFSIICALYTKSMVTFFVLFLVFPFILIILILLYGYLWQFIIKRIIDNVLKISIESRKSVLLLQELLSLNCGYHKLVHFTENANQLELSKSLNREALSMYCSRLNFLLTSFLCIQQQTNQDMITTISNSSNVANENVWIKDISLKCIDNEDIQDVDTNRPLPQLKKLHNCCYSLCIDFIKLLIALFTSISHFGHNCSCLPKLFHVLSRIKICLNNIGDCQKLLIRTTDYFETKFIKPNEIQQKSINDKKNNLFNQLRVYRLHLFELTSFGDIIESNAEVNKDDIDLLQTKSLRHLDSLKVCIEEIVSLIQSEKPQSQVKYAKLENSNEEMQKSEIKQVNESLQPQEQEEQPYEILDEVLEAEIIEEENDKMVCRPSYHTDTFEEKIKSNAKYLLNELESVISVKAAEWKERENRAAERRKAEGKFVFEDRDIPIPQLKRPEPKFFSSKNTVNRHKKVVLPVNDNERLVNSQVAKRMVSKYGTDAINYANECNLEPDSLQMSFSEMILKQRNQINGFGDEEYYED